ncbi:hypothetical protein [Mycolicibacterium diernhoferi]|uniref:hypothetical protein n=1 Tax=Mycolicibacterium diernhoferi TaxID=1801 RepID=UPI000AA83147|nr:hypothetical protein [Mycolicibacterium diernhoferi]
MSSQTAQNPANLDNGVITRFTEAVGGHAEVITDPVSVRDRGHDFWGVGGTAELMLRPHTRDEVAAIMAIAAEYRVAVVPRGGHRTARAA